MVPTLIVLGLLALGVVIVAYATRRRPKQGQTTQGQTQLGQTEQDTAWNDTFTPAGKTSHAAEPTDQASSPPVEPVQPAPPEKRI